MANIIKKAIQKFLTQDATTTLLLMLCIPHLEYANVMLYNVLEKHSINTKPFRTSVPRWH